MIEQNNYNSNVNDGPQFKAHSKRDILSLYLFALKSPVTKDKYTRRLKAFFEFSSIKGETVQEKCIEFVKKAATEGEK